MLEKIENLDESVQDYHQSSIVGIQSILNHLNQLDLKLSLVMSKNGPATPKQVLTIDNLTSGENFQGARDYNFQSTRGDNFKSTHDPKYHGANGDTHQENISSSNGQGLLHNTDWPLPKAEVISKLVDVFFQKIYPGFRAFHPTFRDDILLRVRELRSLSNNLEISPQILGVLVCSLRFAENLLPQTEIDKCLDFCRTSILSQCIGFSLIEELQAMALLAYDSYGRSNNPVTWSYIALIANAVIHLNLTKEPTELHYLAKPNHARTKRSKIISPHGVANLKAPTDSFDEECRRNLFWEIFLLDCLSSVSNSLPCKIIENDINRQIPVRPEFWDSPTSDQASSINSSPEELEHLDLASYLVEVVRKLRRIHTFLREPFDINNVKEVLAWQMQLSEIDSELTKWKDSIPIPYRNFLDHQSLSFTSQVTVKDVLFFAIYHMTIIRLNSSVAYQKFDSNFFLLSSTAKKKCLDLANSIAGFSAKIPNLLNSSSENAYALCGPFYAFALWVAARLLFVNSLRSGEEFSSELDQLISVLSDMGKSWESAARYSDILSFLKSEEIENRLKGQSLLAEINGFNDESNTDNDVKDPTENLANHSKSARMFADMRFNAYSLDVSLLKKIDEYKKNGEEMSPNNKTDFMNLLEWFKIPISMENSPFVPKMDM